MAPWLCASCSSIAPGWYRSPGSGCVLADLGQSDWQEVSSPGGEGTWNHHCPEPRCLLDPHVFLCWLLSSACEFGPAPHPASPPLALTSLGWSLSRCWGSGGWVSRAGLGLRCAVLVVPAAR